MRLTSQPVKNFSETENFWAAVVGVGREGMQARPFDRVKRIWHAFSTFRRLMRRQRACLNPNEQDWKQRHFQKQKRIPRTEENTTKLKRTLLAIIGMACPPHCLMVNHHKSTVQFMWRILTHGARDDWFAFETKEIIFTYEFRSPPTLVPSSSRGAFSCTWILHQYCRAARPAKGNGILNHLKTHWQCMVLQ